MGTYLKRKGSLRHLVSRRGLAHSYKHEKPFVYRFFLNPLPVVVPASIPTFSYISSTPAQLQSSSSLIRTYWKEKKKKNKIIVCVSSRCNNVIPAGGKEEGLVRYFVQRWIQFNSWRIGACKYMYTML